MATYKVAGVGQRGKFFDEQAYTDLLQYICDPAKMVYAGFAGPGSLETAPLDMLQVAEHFGKNNGKRIRHSVLSFDNREQVSAEQADAFAQEIIRHYAPDYQIAYAVHGNTDNTHIHFAMNQVSYRDGHRYAGKKADYYRFKKHMQAVTHLPVVLSKDQAAGSKRER